MKNGEIVAEGTPAEVVTVDVMREVFDLECDVIADPRSGTPLVIPIGRHRVAERSAW
jgi:iron complex transport system ATP-binding protein